MASALFFAHNVLFIFSCNTPMVVGLCSGLSQDPNYVRILSILVWLHGLESDCAERLMTSLFTGHSFC